VLQFGSLDGLYCRYGFHFGPDWSITGGIDTGLSQMSRTSALHSEPGIVWNFPIDIKFKSTNVFGWPRIAISVYGADFLGRDVVRGYGSCLVPLVPGTHTVDVEMYTPMASSFLNNLASWFWGNPPEVRRFFDSKFICQNDGREVTRVQSTGVVRVKFNIRTRGLTASSVFFSRP
ncbi:unnamed protein product, partial [Ectocarpus fasciculatus]